MLKENEYILSRVNIALDWLLAAAALLGAHFLRNYILAPYILPDIFRFQSNFRDYSWLLIFLPTMTVILLSYYGHYRSIRTRGWRSLAGAHGFATVGAALIAMVVSFTFTPRGGGQGSWFSPFTQEFVSRGVLMLYLPVAVGFLQIKEFLVRTYLRNLRNRGLNRQNLLLVGNPEEAADFLKFLARYPDWGLQVVGLITDDEAGDREGIGVPVYNSAENEHPTAPPPPAASPARY